MAEVPVEAIRQSNRYELIINRKKLKHEENDLRRSLANPQLETVDVSALAGKLKIKSEVTVSDLQLLKNILIQEELNIRLFLNTQGALRGLVREISGKDVNRQVAAAGCLCNLALADSRGCLTIIRGAGAYLVAALDSQNLELAITCAWTLGNLCGAGVQACRLLSRAGGVGRLCALARRGDDERAEAAVYALTLFAYAMGDELSKEHLDFIVKSVAGARCSTDFRLYFILSCHDHFSDPNQLIQNQLIDRLPQMMRHHHKCVGQQCCDLVYGIRTLANMRCGSGDYPFLGHVLGNEERRRDFLHLAEDSRTKKDMLWLLGNMSRPHGGNDEQPAPHGEGGFKRFAQEEPELGDMSDDEG